MLGAADWDGIRPYQSFVELAQIRIGVAPLTCAILIEPKVYCCGKSRLSMCLAVCIPQMDSSKKSSFRVPTEQEMDMKDSTPHLLFA
jgi:hypothetical protein